MKVTLIFTTILLVFGCAEMQIQNSEFFYIYYSYPTEENNEITETAHVEYYTGKFVKLIGDSIIIKSHYFDSRFNSISCFSFKYIKDGKKLYRVNTKDEKKLFLSIENNNNVFYQIVYDESGTKSAFEEEEEEEVLGGSNYRFISEIKYKDEITDDSLVLYKFFVRFSPFESTDTTYFSECDYFYYYDNDFVLYKIEYVGNLLNQTNTQRINYLWAPPHGLFNKNIKKGSFIFE